MSNYWYLVLALIAIGWFGWTVIRAADEDVNE